MYPPAFEHQRTRQRRTSRRNMNHGATRKVKRTHFGQKAIRMPAPVRQRCIDQQTEEDRKKHIGREPHPLGDRPNYQPGRDDREHELEHREQSFRYRRCGSPGSTAYNVLIKKMRHRITDNSMDRLTETKTITNHDPQDPPTPAATTLF